MFCDTLFVSWHSLLSRDSRVSRGLLSIVAMHRQQLFLVSAPHYCDVTRCLCCCVKGWAFICRLSCSLFTVVKECEWRHFVVKTAVFLSSQCGWRWYSVHYCTKRNSGQCTSLFDMSLTIMIGSILICFVLLWQRLLTCLLIVDWLTLCWLYVCHWLIRLYACECCRLSHVVLSWHVASSLSVNDYTLPHCGLSYDIVCCQQSVWEIITVWVVYRNWQHPLKARWNCSQNVDKSFRKIIRWKIVLVRS